jgi:putative SOS response-associated peptidase YedK
MAERLRKGTYNARAESIHEKPSFREPFRQGRCLVIAHGFFEWQQTNNARIPWYIRLENNEPFAFAGLHDTWYDPDSGESINSFSIITTNANPLLEKIHNTQKRMPVVLPQKVETEWINGAISLRKASGLLVPIHEKVLHAYTVSNRISEKGADPFDPDTLKPYDHPVTGTLF